MSSKRRVNKAILILLMLCLVFAGFSGMPMALAEETDNSEASCDRIVPLTESTAWLNSVEPGQTVCVEGGERTAPLVLANMSGTAEEPITVKNINGAVEVDINAAWNSALDIRSSKHFILSGTGHEQEQFGFQLGNHHPFGFGLSANRGSTNYTIENVEVYAAGFAGFMLRSDPGSGTSRPDFIQKNTIIRNNYIHHVQNEEVDGAHGVFIGLPNFAENPASHEVQGLRVYNNVITDTGRNGIQIFGATANVRVHDNQIENYGLLGQTNASYGLYIGAGSTGQYFQNKIAHGHAAAGGAGIQNQGKGDVDIFNNLVVEPGQYGIASPAEDSMYYAEDEAFAERKATSILYNTIVHPAVEGHGIYLRESSDTTAGNQVSYNLIVHRADGNEDYIQLKDADYDVSGIKQNFGTQDIASAGFVNADGGDYHLLANAAAAGYGFDPGMDPGPDPGFETDAEPSDPDAGEEPGYEIDPDYVPDPIELTCDANVLSDEQRLWDGAEMGVDPGDVVCIEAGERPEILHLTNFHGTASHPITFINDGGIVHITTDPDNPAHNGMYALKVTKSSHFKLSGTGDRNTKYGFVLNAKGSGGASTLMVTGNSTDYTINNVEVYGAGFAGFMLKTDPSCNAPETTQRPTDDIQPGFVQYNTVVHDNLIQNTDGEGMYIGHYAYAQGYTQSCGTLWPHAIEGLELYNNVIKDTQLDALQIGAATKDVRVYNNHLENYGLANQQFHTNGLEINPGTSGDFFNNKIINGKGAGVNYKGKGDARIFNNLIVEPDSFGIISLAESHSVNEDDPVFDGKPVHISHNTIINPGDIAIYFWNQEHRNAGNTAYNNLIVKENAAAASGEEYVTLRYADTDLTYDNNYTSNQMSEVKFVNPQAHDYRLQGGSPAIDTGTELSGEQSIEKDILGNERILGERADAGAMEYMPTEFKVETTEYEGVERKYALYVPKNYDPAKRWPLIIFHHGAGETGTDGLAQTTVGIGPAIGYTPELQQAIIYMPQRASNAKEEAQFWTEHAQEIAKQYNVEPQRWYLTGLSAGGYITWNYGAEFSDQYAALMPMSGGLGDQSDEKIAKLVDIPILALHGEEDGVILPAWGKDPVDKVDAAGGNARFVIIPGVGHYAWDTHFYGNREFVSWLMEQRNETAYSLTATVDNETPKNAEKVNVTLQYQKIDGSSADLAFQGSKQVTISGYTTLGNGNGTGGKFANHQLFNEQTTVTVEFEDGQAIVPLQLVEAGAQELVIVIEGEADASRAVLEVDVQQGAPLAKAEATSMKK